MALGIAAPGCGGGGPNQSAVPAPPPDSISLTRVAAGFSSPVDLQASDDATGRLFVVEQGGTIRLLRDGRAIDPPFLDLRARVNFSGEMGLLGLAFHPGFARDPRFYVNYVRLLGSGRLQTVIAEYRVTAAGADQADAGSERILLTVDQPFENHKGGQLAFGPDGFLYIALGDGGGAGDPQGNAQNLQSHLGKMLRIDVDRTTGTLGYAIPADNPFAAGGGRPEIWAWGLRNPFRFSFDPPAGRLFAGDAGQDRFEEVDLVERGGNYGWNVMEGLHCFSPPAGCDPGGLQLPIAEYSHSEGIAVIGGFVYRGTSIPALRGSYVFGDFGAGRIWRLTQDAAGAWDRVPVLGGGPQISSFGRDAQGELYVLDYGSGTVFRLSP